MNTTKKFFLFIAFIALIFIFGCNDTSSESDIDKIQKVYDEITLPNSIDRNIDLPTKYGDVEAKWSSSNEDVISSTGIVTQSLENIDVTLSVILSIGQTMKTKQFEVTVLGDKSDAKIREYVEEKIKSITIPTETSENVELIKSIGDISVNWISKTPLIIWHNGIVNRSNVDQIGILSATFAYSTISLTKEYEIKVLKYTPNELLSLSMDKIEIPTEVSFDLNYYMYPELLPGVSVSWTSSNDKVIEVTGKVHHQDVPSTVILTVTLEVGGESMNKDFEVNVLASEKKVKPHQVLNYASDFKNSAFNNVCFKDNRLVLNDDVVEGSYESDEIQTIAFNSLVASWASTSSVDATVELFVKVRVNSVWSDYITYHQWGFGLENKCYDQQNSLIKLSEDEVMVLNNKNGDAIKFKVVLRRKSLDVVSPKLLLVSFALKNNNYSYSVDISDLPNEVVYQVPRLYQGAVPTIGNSICSPTTSTMLLKYMGEDFSSFDEYEHRYIAYKFKEYNSGIFGNWVYNTVGMSSFGYKAYVARMYSVEELVEHLANIGPCGLSVKGQMTSTEKNYYTNGHLIVAIGYKYVNGVLHIVCNDPNVPNVYCEYSVNVIKNTWRNVAYVIEKA